MPSLTEKQAMHPADRNMPSELIAAMAMVKRACAQAGRELELVYPGMAKAIDLATSQITSDPCAALHVAARVGIAHNLLPALAGLSAELGMDQKLSKHVSQLALAQEAIIAALPSAHQLAMQQSTSLQVQEQVAKALTLSLPFVDAANTSPQVSRMDQMVDLHGSLKATAVALSQVAQTMRQLSPAQQDAMQCDALAMVCRQVVGNDADLAKEAGTKQTERPTFPPVLAQKLLQSIRLLADATSVFTEYFVRGVSVNRDRKALIGLASSLMLVTDEQLQPV